MAFSDSDVPKVFSLLCDLLNTDQNLRDQAEATLSLYQFRRGLCSCLMKIIIEEDQAYDAVVRRLALDYLKDIIKANWRNGDISNEEKKLLRNQLLCHIWEENDEIAQKLASLISKIARIDYPLDWPELFSDLAQQLVKADILTSSRIYGVLSCTIKKLSAAGVRAVQRNFAKIVPYIFDRCWVQWLRDYRTITQNFSSAQCFSINTSVEQQNLHLTRERWFSCSNIVLQLILSGFEENLVKGPPVKEVCSGLIKAVQSFLPYYSIFSKASSELLFIEKACVTLMQLLVHIQFRHPYPFSDEDVLKPILTLCLDKIMGFKPEITPPPFDQFPIECMALVKSVLECIGHKRSVSGCVDNVDRRTAKIMKRNISSVVASVLPSEEVELLCAVLIKRYFPLTKEDFKLWAQNPERFYHKQNRRTSKTNKQNRWTMEKLRPCAEALYIVLFDHNSKLLGPLVHSILCEAMGKHPAQATDTLSNKLLREAAYTAVGHVCYGLNGILNFIDWFDEFLYHELYDGHHSMHFIHRRIALLLQKWVMEIKGAMKKKVFCALIMLLSYEDLAVRLTACQSLIILVGRIDFWEDDFTDQLPLFLDMCLKLLKECEGFQSKALVVNLFISITEGMAEKTIPFANVLANFFQKVWVEINGSSVLRTRVGIALSNFIIKHGIHSSVRQNILPPILKMCIFVNNPDELNLLKCGMLLWESAISNAPSMVPELLEVFPYLLAVMEKSFADFQVVVDNNFDHFEVAIKIFEGYIILGKGEIFSKHASVVAQLLDGILKILLQLFSKDVPPVMINFLQKLIVIFLSGGDDSDPSTASVKAIVGAILARLLVMNMSFLVRLTRNTSVFVALQQAGVSVEQNIIFSLADLWIDEIDNMTAAQRKNCALALSFVLTIPEPVVLDKLDQILSVCTSVLLGGCEDFNREGSSENSGSMPFPESVDLRRRQIKDSDPVLQSLQNSLKDNLEGIVARYGDTSYRAAICSTTVQQLQQALNLAPESDLYPADVPRSLIC